MLERLEVSTVLPISREELYNGWLDSEEHSEFSGGTAEIDPTEGGRFTAWEGYIEGKNLILEPYSRIVQAWRTSEFPETSEDSRLEILLDETEEGTRITLVHTEIPEGLGERFETGWVDHYFMPMAEYYEGDLDDDFDDY
ncbi:MAG: SRPBCC domain-containing protein [Bacteroidia bacterium]|nr:SRPBCC domain-containing protein [Bacteroidia bacterium]